MQEIYQENLRKKKKNNEKCNINYKENIRKTQGKHQKFTRKTCEISIKSGICKKNTRNFQILSVNYQKFPPETGGSVKYCTYLNLTAKEILLLWMSLESRMIIKSARV